jgi:hypothetical protein
MAIDFPNSPTTGQIFTVGDKSWIWDGTVWKAYGASLSPTVLKVDSTNSRVGINNQSPATALDVTGTALVRAAATQDGVALAGRAGGTSSYEVTLTPTTLTADRTLTLPDATGTVALTTDPGLVYITGTTVTSGSSSSVSFTGCFSSTYDSYRIVVEGFQPSVAARGLMYRMRSGTTDNTSAVYATIATGRYLDGTDASFQESGQIQGNLGMYNTDTTIPVSNSTFDIHAPNLATRTYLIGQTTLFNSQFGIRNFVSIHGTETSFDGITFLMSASGNVTKVRIRIYGYRNS